MFTQLYRLGAVAVLMTLSVSSIAAQEATPEPSAIEGPDRVTVVREGLFPEGVEYNSVSGQFLVSSLEGTVYTVSDDGTPTPFIQDERIPSSLGLEFDEAGNRLLVAATDLQASAFLGIYDATSGDNIAFVDLTAATPNDVEHFANDIAVDGEGNAYVTDSTAGVIYRVDSQGTPSVFLEDDSFSTQFALNGIAYNAAGDYLLAVRVPDLIKIPLSDPTAFTVVSVGTPLAGADGIVFLDEAETTLAVVSNVLGTVYQLNSQDEWATAAVTGSFNTGLVQPTTVAARDGSAYVLYSYLNEEEDILSEFPIQRAGF